MINKTFDEQCLSKNNYSESSAKCSLSIIADKWNIIFRTGSRQEDYKDMLLVILCY